MIEPLKLFMTEGGVIMPYDRLNMLIITDYTDNVQKIMEIIRLLDEAFINPELIELIEIKYNASADIADDLKKIFGSGGKDSPSGIYFVSLDRMNAILVMANSKRALGEFKRWVEKLDATTGRTVQTYIYTVENSTASNIMMILTALFGGGEGTGGGTNQTGTGRSGGVGGGVGGTGGFGSGGTAGSGGGAFGAGTAAQTGGSMGGFGGGQYGGYGGGFGGQGYGGYGGGGMGGFGGGYGGYGQGGYGGYGGGGMGGYGGYGGGGGVFGGGSQLGPRLNQAPAMSSQVFRGGPLTGLQESVRIVANDVNNTLVIQASPADYAYLLDVIKKLDVLPRQVIIDARIFEVDLTNDLSFGVQAILQGRSDGPHQTTGQFPDANAGGALTAGTFAFVGDAREILLNLSALRSKTKVKVLEA
ncbi:MAG TPA: secretin N-terminal domain-containing protein, partial [Tepidisphaeraceae bacterium]|nr:secretin N-terminal domain-containing protein [Tepidisphaeraceae bacterium]